MDAGSGEIKSLWTVAAGREMASETLDLVDPEKAVAMLAKKREIEVAALLAVVLLAIGCERTSTPAPAPAPAMKPAPPTPIDIKRAEIGGPMWDPAWDQIIEQAIPPELLSAQISREVRPFCPRFESIDEADKRAFWAYFFQALAGAEGGLKPTARVRHAQAAMQVKDDVTGVQGRTEGLLQLAYADQKRYGCDFDWDSDRKLKTDDPSRTILQPRNNLECGVKILDHELMEQHKPLLSRTEYWSTLQPGTASYRVFAKQMANVPEACGRRTGTAEKASAQPIPTQEQLSASR